MGYMRFPVGGMSCAACAARVEKALNRLDGVTAAVNYATEQATVEYDPALATADTLADAVERAGYSARLADAEIEDVDPLRLRLIVAGVLAVPVLLVAMIPALHFRGWEWVVAALSTVVVFWAGWPFHHNAWAS